MNASTPSDFSKSTLPPEAAAFLQSGGEEVREFSAPLGGATQGRLEFTHGASRITLRVDPSMPELYRARFLGPVPEVRVVDGTVAVRYHLSFSDWLDLALPWRRAGGEILLNGSIPWHLDFHGGVSDISGDLTQLQLRALDVGGGVSNVRLRLPRPSSIVPIDLHGGASNVVFSRPVGTAARVEIDGGASALDFDEQHLGAVGGSIRLASPGIDDRPHRYEIRVRGGVSHITINAR
jgi:hypothetical protein